MSFEKKESTNEKIKNIGSGEF